MKWSNRVQTDEPILRTFNMTSRKQHLYFQVLAQVKQPAFHQSTSQKYAIKHNIKATKTLKNTFQHDLWIESYHMSDVSLLQRLQTV